MKKMYVLIDLSGNYLAFDRTNLNNLKRELGELNILDVSKLVKSKFKINQNNFTDFNITVLENFKQLKKFLNNKEIVFLYCLGINYKSFLLNFFIARSNAKKFIISNLGYNPQNFNYYKKNFIERLNIFFKLRFKVYFNRVLVLLKIVPKIDYFFESSSFIIKSIREGRSNKIKKRFNRINLSYYLDVIRINSKHFDNLFYSRYPISEEYIVFIDSMFDHKDRIMREGIINPDKRKKYYDNLYIILKKLENYYNKKVVICLHPKNNISEQKKEFKDFFCIKYQTEKYISQADIVVFHESSSIIQAIVQKKKILSLNGDILGDYLRMRSNIYPKSLDLYQIDIDEPIIGSRDYLDKKLNEPIKNYKNYIEENIINDPSKSGILQIIDYLGLK